MDIHPCTSLHARRHNQILVYLRYGLTSLTSPNFFLAASVDTDGGTMTSSPTFQSIGVVTPFLSPVWRLSMTRRTSVVFRPKHQKLQGSATFRQHCDTGLDLRNAQTVSERRKPCTFQTALPVEAGYIIVRRIFLLGSITKTERMVKAMPFSSMLSRSCWSTISYWNATLRSASAMIGNESLVLEISLMSWIQRPWLPKSLALCRWC